LFRFLDLEKLIQLRDLEYFVNLRVDVTQDQPAAAPLQLLVQRYQLAKGRAGEILDVAKVEQELTPPNLVDQAEQLLADDLNILFVQDLAIDEINHGDIADVFDFQATTAWGLR